MFLIRLTKQEVVEIIHAIEQHCSPKGAELRLYGSRVDPNQKGGDIDLLLIVPDSSMQQQVESKKLDILVEIKFAIGDQKIDFTIKNTTDLLSDPFLRLIMPTSKVLHQW